MKIKNLSNIKEFTRYTLVILLTLKIFEADLCVICTDENANDTRKPQSVIRRNGLTDMGVDSFVKEMIDFAQNWIDQNSEEIKNIENEITKYTESLLMEIRHPGRCRMTRWNARMAGVMRSIAGMQPKGTDQKDFAFQCTKTKKVYAIRVKFFKSVKDKTNLTYYPWLLSYKERQLYLFVFIFDPIQPGEVNKNDPACGFIIADGTNRLPRGSTR